MCPAAAPTPAPMAAPLPPPAMAPIRAPNAVPPPILELLTKPCFQSIKCLPLLAGRVLVCTIHEHSFTPRCFVESDSTDVAVRTAETQRWQTSLARPCLSYWDSVRPAQWDSLGDAATRAGMRLR